MLSYQLNASTSPPSPQEDHHQLIIVDILGSPLLRILLQLWLVQLTTPGQKVPLIPPPATPSLIKVATTSNQSTTFLPPMVPAKWSSNSLNEDFDPRQVYSTFKSSRYGLRIDHCPNGGEPELNEQDGRIRLCQLDAECKPSYKCENIVGLTHFGKQMRYCCPTKTSVCTLKPKLDTDSPLPIRCHRPLLRTFFYFDVDQLKCVKSRMAQCEEFGENRFASELECRTKCETTACELGESILLHNNSFDSPFQCFVDDDCPIGYNCRPDRIFRRSVCCGFLNFEPCPLGFRSFTVPFTGRAKRCRNSATRDECPTDYVCTPNAISQEEFCCTVEKGVCPEGHQAYIHPLTDGTIKCNLRSYDVTTSCPPGYVCLAAVFGSPWGFCCAQAMIGKLPRLEEEEQYALRAFIHSFIFLSLLASCPEDSFPQINPVTNQPQRCELTQQEPSVCSHGFECETDEANHLGFCCSIRKHERVKPSPEPTPRKKAKHHHTLAIAATTTPTTTMRTTTTTPTKTTTTPSMVTVPTMSSSPPATVVVTMSIGGGRRTTKGKKKKNGKKKGRWKEGDGGKKKKSRKKQKDGSAGDGDSSSPSYSSSSEERSEKADLIELSTKLDRFISGVKRRIQLPRGHLRPRPHIWRLRKSHRRRKWRPEDIRRIFGENKGPPEEEADELRGLFKSKLKKKGKEERRLVEDEEDEDNNKEEEEDEEIEDGEATSSSTTTTADEENTSGRPHHQLIRLKPKCPHGHRLMAYPGSRGTYLECELPEEEEDGGGGGVDRKRRRRKKGGGRGRKKKMDSEEEDELEEEKNTVGEDKEEHRERTRDDIGHQRSTACPGPSVCMPARDDPFGRAVCCLEKEAVVEAEEVEGDGKQDEAEEEEDENGRNGEEEEGEETEEVEGGKNSSSSLSTSATSSVIVQLSTTTTALTTTTRSPNIKVLVLERSDDPSCPHLIAGRICEAGSTDVCVEEGFFCQYNKDRKDFVCCTLINSTAREG